MSSRKFWEGAWCAELGRSREGRGRNKFFRDTGSFEAKEKNAPPCSEDVKGRSAKSTGWLPVGDHRLSRVRKRKKKSGFKRKGEAKTYREGHEGASPEVALKGQGERARDENFAVLKGEGMVGGGEGGKVPRTKKGWQQKGHSWEISWFR